jgi:hypothetical protein
MSQAERLRAHRWAARAAGCGLLLTLLGPVLGATLSSESSVALTSEYTSNPFLRPSGASAAESAALLANFPATYTSDSESFDIVPRMRFAETHGDPQLLSDYQYLDGDWRINSERNSFTASAAWHRDSTFYNVYENAALQGRTLPRLEDTASLAWQRALSERSNLQLGVSWDQVAYSARSSFRLDNYSYAQGSLQYVRALSERWNWTSSAGFDRYDLREQVSSNENRFIQTALNRALSERWSMTAQVGYSRLSASSQGYICCRIVQTANGYALQYIPIEQRSSGGAVNYALSVERKGERFDLNFAVSRSVQPSLGTLLTRDDMSLGTSLPWTERMTLGATLHGSRQSDTLQSSAPISGRFYDFVLYANWFWSEHWTLALQTSYDVARAIVRLPEGSGATVSLTLTRQLGHIRL